jgi:hypothetical protein
MLQFLPYLQVHPSKVEHCDRQAAVRNAFALCLLTQMLNDALQDYRRAACSEEQYLAGLAKTPWRVTDLKLNTLAQTEKWEELGAL